MTNVTTTPETITYLHAVQSVLTSQAYDHNLDMHEVELVLGGHWSGLDTFTCACHIMSDRLHSA